MSLARTRGVFERDVLPTYLARTRWYPERSAREIRPTVTSAVPFCDIGDNRPWLAFFEATTEHGESSRYVLPMQIEWVRFDRERYNPQRLCGGPPGRARRHAAGRRHRPDLHRPAAAQPARIPRRRGRRASRLEFRPTAKLLRAAVQAAGAYPRGRDRAIQLARRWSTTTTSSRSIASSSPASIRRSRSAAS